MSENGPFIWIMCYTSAYMAVCTSKSMQSFIVNRHIERKGKEEIETTTNEHFYYFTSDSYM